MTIYHSLIAVDWLPWRFRNSLEGWVENCARLQYPMFYRWLHSGHWRDPVRAVTHGPCHHFFGYYDKPPWNSSGRYLLAHEADFNDRPPNATDRVGIGVVDMKAGNIFAHLAWSNAWNWQQGSMAQWHPIDPENLIVHNDRRCNRFVGVVRHIEKGEMAIYDRPLYALLPNGAAGFSLNFARLASHRPGYGYAGVRDVFSGIRAPAEDGVWRVELSSGRADLIVSLAELASRNSKPSMEDAWHYVNHIQPSRKGKRIAFFHLWHRDARKWEVRLYTCRPDGSELSCLLDTGFISHYDWRDDDTILVWANRPNASPRFLLISHATPDIRIFGEDVLKEDGHCTFSPDGQWILNDTYPDGHHMRNLMLIRVEDCRRLDVARLHSSKTRWWGEIRCDLHPRWSRDGYEICLDSVHEGSRQMYIINIAHIVR